MVNRVFRAPKTNQPWVSDFTYGSTWQGFAYMAFAIDIFAKRAIRQEETKEPLVSLPAGRHGASMTVGVQGQGCT